MFTVSAFFCDVLSFLACLNRCLLWMCLGGGGGGGGDVFDLSLKNIALFCDGFLLFLCVFVFGAFAFFLVLLVVLVFCFFFRFDIRVLLCVFVCCCFV